MLIIFGFRVRTKDVEHLVFFCPGCGGDRQGARQVLRRWFALFFIPIIPLNVLGEVVRCSTCGRTYRPEVLHRPTTAVLGQSLDNAIRALTVMVVAVGDRTSPALRAKAVEAVGSVAPGYTDDTLTSDLGVLDPAMAPQYVAPLAEGLAPAGAERFLGDLVRVASAAGPMGGAQRALIDTAGRELGLSTAHIAGIVATAAPDASPATWPPTAAPPTDPPIAPPAAPRADPDEA